MSPLYSLKNLVSETQKLIESQLWAKVLAFLFLGLLTGYLIGPSFGMVPAETSALIADWLSLPGRIFLILMQMIILPLVLSSVILGVLSAKSVDTLKKISVRLVPYFVFTTIVAILIGFASATLIKPGSGINAQIESKGVTASEVKQVQGQSLPKTVVSLLPKNPLGSMIEGELLQIVIFSILIGVALLQLSTDSAQPLIQLLASTQQLAMVVVGWAMKIAPIAVFGLMAELLSQVGPKILVGVGWYVLTVISALLGILVFYLLLVSFVGKRNPFKFLVEIRQVQILAFSTSSSAAVLPLTIETAEKTMGIRPSLSRFVIPLGATINMDGTAAYQGVAAYFIAQAYGLDLTLGQLALIVVSATGASIGAPGTPGVGMAVLATILASVGIPAEGILLIMGVDRILDMLRTSVNVTGDLTAATVLEKLLPEDDSVGS